MNVNAVDATTTALTTQSASVANPPTRKATAPAAPSAPAAPAAPVKVAVAASPAATVSISGIPASVKPQDRAMYTQILKAVGGNVNAALAALSAFEAEQAAKGAA